MMNVVAVIIFLGLCTLFFFSLNTEEEKEWHKFRNLFYSRSPQEATAWFHDIETKDLEPHHYSIVMREYHKDLIRIANSEIYSRLSMLQTISQ